MQHVLHTQLDEDTIHTTAVVLRDEDSEVEDTYIHIVICQPAIGTCFSLTIPMMLSYR